MLAHIKIFTGSNLLRIASFKSLKQKDFKSDIKTIGSTTTILYNKEFSKQSLW